MRKQNVAIVDDSPTDIAILSRYIKANNNLKLMFVATNGKDLLQKLKLFSPDIILLDIYMPVLDGLETLDLIKDYTHKIKVLVCSNGYSTGLINRLENKGAFGFSRKQGEFIMKALDNFLLNKPFFDVEYTKDWEQNGYSSIIPLNNVAEINGTELEIINLISQGYSAKEISTILQHLSPSTIETYTTAMINRFGLKNAKHLVAFAYVNGLLNNFDAFNSLPKPVYKKAE